MKQLKILVICCTQEILDTIIRLINKDPEMNGTAANNAAQALLLFQSQTFDLVLLGSGLTADEEQELEAALKKSKRGIPVIHHFGGGSGLLFTEIKQALNKS